MTFRSNQFLDDILDACRPDRKTAGQGAGEGGIVAVAAAIGNAVAAARIWRLVQDAQTAAGAREQ